MTERLKRIIACPSCRKSVAYDQSNPYRPFCSERCKTQDIAGWAEESFRIPGEQHMDEFSEQDLGRSDNED